MSRTTRQKMQSPAETSQSSETDPGKAEASGVVGLSADDNDYTNDRSNKRAASSSSSPLPSLSTSTPFAGVQTNFGGMSLLFNLGCIFVIKDTSNLLGPLS